MKLIRIYEDKFDDFANEVQKTFQLAVKNETNENVISKDEIFSSLNHKNARVFYIYQNDIKIGGVCLLIDDKTQINSLDLFYILEKYHGKGYGFRVWEIIEKTFYKTRVWTTVTPHFEIRNIYFYINKCGFKIVKLTNMSDKFHNKKHLEWFFEFEKVMK